MPSLNKLQLIGHLGRNPETKDMKSGDLLAYFDMAVSRNVKDKVSNEWKSETIWLRASAFGRTAEYVRDNLQKGDCVFVDGRLNIRKYEHNGVEKLSVECNATQIFKLERAPRRDRDEYNSGNRQNSGYQSPKPDLDDDLPF